MVLYNEINHVTPPYRTCLYRSTYRIYVVHIYNEYILYNLQLWYIQ